MLRIAVAMPIELGISVSPFTARTRTGFAASGRRNPRLAVHASLHVTARVSRPQLTRRYAAIDGFVTPSIRAIAEVGAWPLVVEIGGHTKWQALNVKLAIQAIEGTRLDGDVKVAFFVRF